MPDEAELRRILHDNLEATIRRVNAALRGKGLAKLTRVLARLGRGGQLPHWFQRLRSEQSLPNLDGKTIGSVVEMLLVAVIETSLFEGMGHPAASNQSGQGCRPPRPRAGREVAVRELLHQRTILLRLRTPARH